MLLQQELGAEIMLIVLNSVPLLIKSTISTDTQAMSLIGAAGKYNLLVLF